jgi:hypothetical protein
MKAVISNAGDKPPCIIYWTGRIKFHVGVVTYCKASRDATDGVLQVPDDVPCCSACEVAVERRDYPKTRA